MNVFDALIQQESSGRPGVVGQRTKYGVPLGLTQMLPATAREMAGKLGLPWQPELMTGTTPDAAAYQRQLGQAYYQQGLDATGNERDALRYYHGGPNPAMWGPKTNAYADSVLARVNGASPMPARKPRTLADIAAPGAPQPVDIASDPMQTQGLTLGDLASLPQGNIPNPNKGKQTLGDILGVLGDALMAYGGLSPQFAPALRQQRRDDAEAQQARDRLNTDVQLAQMKAMEPPQWLQDAQTFNALSEPQKQMVTSYRDVVNPIVADVQNPDGSVIRRVFPRQLPPKAGQVEDGYVFLGGDPADPKNWRAQ